MGSAKTAPLAVAVTPAPSSFSLPLCGPSRNRLAVAQRPGRPERSYWNWCHAGCTRRGRFAQR
eukprot:7304581-Alexandrium_andersonii.AAC.1